LLNSKLSWRFTFVELERVELKADQEPHDGRMVAIGCSMKRGPFVFGLQKRVGAVLDKELGDLQVAVVTSPEESGPSTLPTTQSHSTTRANTYAVLIVDDRLVSAHQPLHFGKVAAFDGFFEIFSGHLGGTLRKVGKKTES
jgi:hypothetical protein